MISESHLSDAVARGLITAEQAAALRALAAAPASPTTATDDPERLRFISGFGDIFVTLGIGLFLGAVHYFGHSQLGPAGGGLLVAAAAWALAEFFTRSRRMALPSIVLLLVFAVSVFLAAMAFLAAHDGVIRSAGPGWPNVEDPLALVSAALVTLGATALHYWRFRVPITVAAGAASVAAALVGLVQMVFPALVYNYLSAVLFVCGVAIFALAMRFDISDPQRLTRRTDIAFWLHLLAAPLIVHPLVSGFVANLDGPSLGSAWGVLAIFAALAVVAILVDRRAMLVSGLAYAGYAFSALIGRTGFDDSVVPLTMLALGAFVLGLSAGWQPIRSSFVRLLPDTLARWLRPPEFSSSNPEYRS